jgi:hypothetical protein
LGHKNQGFLLKKVKEDVNFVKPSELLECKKADESPARPISQNGHLGRIGKRTA